MFYVEDTGIGMSESVLKRIYERFYRMERSNMKIYRGTGLGLTITKKLVSLLGGEINVSCRDGQGTRFEVTIPIRNE